MSSARDLIGELAGAIVDQEPIDWNLVDSRGSRETEADIRQLQAISRIASARPSDHLVVEDRERTHAGPLWMQACLVVLIGLATSHVIAAFVGFVVNPPDRQARTVPPLAPVLNMAAYWFVGCLLAVGGRGRDRRAWHLGAFFIVAASAMAGRFLPPLSSVPVWLRWWRILFPETFMPFLLWLFVRDFPRLGRFTQYDLIARRLTVFSGISGVILCLATALKVLNVRGPWAALARNDSGPYWAIIFGLEIGALVIIILRARSANADEHRRVGVFLGGLVVGGAPILIQVILAVTIPAYFAWLVQPDHLYVATLVVYGFSVFVPLTSAYSVLVARLFDLRPMVRRALKYAWLDRRLLGPVVDSRTALTQMGAQMVQAGGIRDVANLVVEHVTRALDVDHAVVLVRGTAQGAFIPLAGACRPLPPTSAIATLVGVSSTPLYLDAEGTGSFYRLLPPQDREWVIDASCSVIVPIHPSRQLHAALLLVGGKRSDLPFDRDDHLFLESVASSVALGFASAAYRENELIGNRQQMRWNDEAAAECTICGRLASWESGRSCRGCGGAMTGAVLPAFLTGKFRVERVLGRGGMGIVYLGEDLDLGRMVAIKTMPRVSLTQIKRLRGEARAMAAVTHPNLAVIYGLETWRGTPLLIVEYLPRGTLAERLLKGPLVLKDAVALGVAVAAALDRMHRIGMLHRDVKPSNVGYSEDGTPKLLDFGLARLLGEADAAPRSKSVLLKPERFDGHSTATTGFTHLSGTPLYLSPETIAGASPDPLSDVWSLSVMLFEALTGSCPFHAASATEVFDKITHVDSDRLCRALDRYPGEVGDFFRRSLANDRMRRPGSAEEFRRELARLHALGT